VISVFNKFSTTRKVLLIAGIIILLLSTCVIFPIEYSKASFVEEFVYTYLTLAIALFSLMFGLMWKHFFKGLLFVVISSIVGAFFFYVAYPVVPFAAFIAIWLGIPSGIITALIFMIVNFYFFKEQKSYRLLKQIAVYFIILLVVSVLFGYGGDWI
jgi:hypothetical protein